MSTKWNGSWITEAAPREPRQHVHTVRSPAAADIDASRGGNRTSGVGELPTRRAVSRSRSVSSLDTDRRCCYVMVDIRCLCIELVDRH